ncbi:MAG: DNA repair protein RecO [Chitinophagales bacterium]
MYHKTKGIVLHTIKYSETSVIAKIYTEGFGLLSFIVKGVRSTKSKNKASLLQPLTILDMEISHRENKGLQFIKEFRRFYNYSSLPFDTLKSAIALFLLEVISKAIREHETNEEMFVFIEDSLIALDKELKLNPDFHLVFLVNFARHLGFMPHDNFNEDRCYFEMRESVFVNVSGPTTLNKSESRIVNELLTANLFTPLKTKLTRAERKQMLAHLIKYYQWHIENFSLKSPEVLEEILD